MKNYSNKIKLSNYELIKLNDSNNYIIEYLKSTKWLSKYIISAIYFSLKEGIKKGEKLIFKCKKNDGIKNTIEVMDYILWIYRKKYIKINNENLRLWIYVRENKLHEVNYCLETTETTIKLYKNKFQIPYYRKIRFNFY